MVRNKTAKAGNSSLARRLKIFLEIRFMAGQEKDLPLLPDIVLPYRWFHPAVATFTNLQDMIVIPSTIMDEICIIKAGPSLTLPSLSAKSIRLLPQVFKDYLLSFTLNVFFFVAF